MCCVLWVMYCVLLAICHVCAVGDMPCAITDTLYIFGDILFAVGYVLCARVTCSGRCLAASVSLLATIVITPSKQEIPSSFTTAILKLQSYSGP